MNDFFFKGIDFRETTIINTRLKKNRENFVNSWQEGSGFDGRKLLTLIDSIFKTLNILFYIFFLGGGANFHAISVNGKCNQCVTIVVIRYEDGWIRRI